MEKIEVVYRDGLFGFVSCGELSRLIEADRIVKFARDESWAYVGVDPVRSGRSLDVSVERRQAGLYA